MSEAIDIPLESDDHLVDPPIVDYLFVDADRDVYVVTFVPEDSVSPREKEVVEVPQDSQDGKRIELRLSHIGLLIGGAVARVFHAGGGDFGFYRTDGQLFQMSRESRSSGATQELYTHLQDLAQVAQIAFIGTRTPATKTA